MKLTLFLLLLGLSLPAFPQDSTRAVPHWPPQSSYVDSLLRLTRTQDVAMSRQQVRLTEYASGKDRRESSHALLITVLILGIIGAIVSGVAGQ